MVPENAQGLDCDRSQPDCAVPTNTPIRLSFDRPLWPSTAVRQSISIFVKQSAAYSPFLSPEYDLLTRSVTFRMGGTLLPGVLYQLRLPIAESPSDAGFRAFDGAPLEDGPVLTSSSFFTADGPRDMAPPPSFEEPTCAQVVEVLRSTCASSCCHGSVLPAMGLALDSADALTETAILRVAHQAETGSALGSSFVDPARFGVGMRRIEPARSYASYVMYKLLRNRDNLAPCAEGSRFCDLPGANECSPLSEAEDERLAGWFVRGEPMPPTPQAAHWMGCDDLPARPHLDCGDLRAISRFIDRGASCP
jgi:hypothetical protein